MYKKTKYSIKVKKTCAKNLVHMQQHNGISIYKKKVFFVFFMADMAI